MTKRAAGRPDRVGPETYSLTNRIAVAADRLTPVERRLAEMVAADPTILAFGNAADLAARASTSRPSVIRFAVKLGFDGYSGLQEHIRAGMAFKAYRPADRVRRDIARSTALADIDKALSFVSAEAETGKIETAVALLARSRAVWLLSGETSAAGALTLLSGLTMLRPGVSLLEERTFPRDLASVQKEDVVVAIGFYRHRRWAVEATRALATNGAAIIAITDGPLSPLASNAKIRFEVIVPAVGPFDSSVPPVAMAELLVAGTARALGAAARKRIDRIEEMWAMTKTFVDD